MSDLKMSDLLRYQQALLEKHKEDWDPHIPENGRNSLLWCIDEIGEVIAIIKKKGDKAIMENEHVRAHFVEECSDVMMYFVDMLDCYGIDAEEFSNGGDILIREADIPLPAAAGAAALACVNYLFALAHTLNS